jgi:hypothetical protein
LHGCVKGHVIAERKREHDRRWPLDGQDGWPQVELRLRESFTHSLPIAKEQGCGSSGKGFAEAGTCAASEPAGFFLR